MTLYIENIRMFSRLEISSGILPPLAVVLAMVIENSVLAPLYKKFNNLPLSKLIGLCCCGVMTAFILTTKNSI